MYSISVESDEKQERSRMKITPDIRKALELAIEHHGNVTQFSKSLGIAHSTVLFWLSGKTSEINGRLWARKLRYELQPYLADGAGKPLRSSTNLVPLYSAQDMKKFDLTIEPISGFVKRIRPKHGFIFAHEKTPSYFAVRLDPKQLPFSLAVLADGGKYPENGDMAVARIRKTGEIVLGRLEKTDSLFTITDIHVPQDTFSWNPLKQPGFLCWIFPVVEIQSDLTGMKSPDTAG